MNDCFDLFYVRGLIKRLNYDKVILYIMCEESNKMKFMWMFSKNGNQVELGKPAIVFIGK